MIACTICNGTSLTDQSFGMGTEPGVCPVCSRVKDTTAGGVEAVREALAALKPFVDIANEYDDAEDDDFQVWRDFDVLGATLPLRNFRRARAAHERLSALIPPATGDGAGAAEIKRVHDWLLERNREHLYATGVMIRRHPGDAEMFLDAAILLSKLAASPAPAPAAGGEDELALTSRRESGLRANLDEIAKHAHAIAKIITRGALRPDPATGLLEPAPSPKAGETGNG